MNISNGKDLAALIVKAFGLPTYTESVVIEISGRSPCIQMTYKAFMTDEDEKVLGKLLQKCEIVPISGQFEQISDLFEPVWDLVKFCQTGNGYQ
jgi:hypothetical protein